MSRSMTIELKELVQAAASLEHELGKKLHSHPLIFKAKRELEGHMHHSMQIRYAKSALGISEADGPNQEVLDLVRECWAMIECATLILHD